MCVCVCVCVCTKIISLIVKIYLLFLIFTNLNKYCHFGASMKSSYIYIYI